MFAWWGCGVVAGVHVAYRAVRVFMLARGFGAYVHGA